MSNPNPGPQGHGSHRGLSGQDKGLLLAKALQLQAVPGRVLFSCSCCRLWALRGFPWCYLDELSPSPSLAPCQGSREKPLADESNANQEQGELGWAWMCPLQMLLFIFSCPTYR